MSPIASWVRYRLYFNDIIIIDFGFDQTVTAFPFSCENFLDIINTQSMSLLAFVGLHVLLLRNKIQQRTRCNENSKMFSYRREIALQGGLVMAQNGRLKLGDNTLRTL